MEELLEFLLSEKLISIEEIKYIKHDSAPHKLIYEHLEKLKVSDKLLLLDYEWSLLPVERLKLTVITERNKREFAYNS